MQKEYIQIPLSRPDITEVEVRYVNEVLKTPYLSLGPKLGEFEDKMASYLGVRHGVAVNSGTSALHLALKSIEIKEDDGVITTPFSFVASANCILYEGARPIFVDIDPETLNIDPDKIEEVLANSKSSLGNNSHSPKIKAILPVHIFGHPCEMDGILQIAEKYNLEIIEDACEALGAEYRSSATCKAQSVKMENKESKIKDASCNNSRNPIDSNGWKKVGSFGRAGVFGFYPNKQITTAEGGMIVTDDEELAKICRSLRNQGRDEGDSWLLHERLGYNYRLSDLHCALGIAQLQRIEELLAKRENVAQWYKQRLKGIEGIRIPYSAPDVRISWFVYVIRLGEGFTHKKRDEILGRLRAEGIGCSNYFPPIHLQPFYARSFGYKKGDFPITESVSERTIALPFYTSLTQSEIDYIVERLIRACRKTKNLTKIFIPEVPD